MNKRLIIKDILTCDELQSRVTPLEWQHAATFRSQHRQREWLSWRVALRESLGEESFLGVGGDVEIGYKPSGAPYIVGTPIYISVSHTKTHIAVMLCDTPCAIDMELLDRKFSAISSRYLAPSEVEILSSLGDRALAIGWCAKESAYKFIGDKPLDFIGDITIKSVDTQSNTLSISIQKHHYIARFTSHNEWCLVEITGQNPKA